MAGFVITKITREHVPLTHDEHEGKSHGEILDGLLKKAAQDHMEVQTIAFQLDEGEWWPLSEILRKASEPGVNATHLKKR